MLDLVVSGGETGADQAGWIAAGTLGISTGGWMPRGFLTEDGPRPEFAKIFCAIEAESADYSWRTRANVRDSDATVWFGDPGSPEGRDTIWACTELGKPISLVIEGVIRSSDVAAWIMAEGYRTLNVAGNRESTSPGIGDRTERFMIRVFRTIGY